MHEAYKINSIIKAQFHIESIAAFNQNIIIGTKTGQLIEYFVDTDETKQPQLVKFSKTFSKKQINQLEAVADENLLFVLTDLLIVVVDNSQTIFTTIHTADKTKGASIFALDVKTSKSLTGERATFIRLCVAVKRKLQIYYWKFNKLVECDIFIDLKDVPRALSWIDDAICVGYKDEYVLYDISTKQTIKHDLVVTSSSHNMDPCISVIKKEIFGLTKDEHLISINPKDYTQKDPKDPKEYERPKPPKPIAWSNAVLGLVWDEPYIFGRTANSVEVRSLTGSSVIETIVQNIPELRTAKFLVRGANGLVFAAAIAEVWFIKAVDIPTQRESLLKQEKFQLAIELTNLSSEPDDIKNEKIRNIHTTYAKHLFKNKQFDMAMTEFSKLQTDPYAVIRLFPNLLEDSDSSENVFALALEDRDLESALLALISFLTEARQREIQKMSESKNSSKSLLLTVIDTTLLKCYLQTNDSLVAHLLKLKHCHFKESEKTLKKFDKLSELIILYEVNGEHRKALEFLQSHAEVEGSSLYGFERTVNYLQRLSKDQKHLIFEFSEWILLKNPEVGLKIFTEDLEEIENLPRAEVLDFLIRKHKNSVIPYLEHIINVWKESKPIFHNILICQYRNEIQVLMKNGENNDKLGSLKSKLLTFLTTSDKYAPDNVLQDFPTDCLLEERAIILGKLRKHEKVLVIYLQVLGDIEKAKQYCADVYHEDNDIYILLLKTILRPSKTPPYENVEIHKDFMEPNVELGVSLLEKYACSIDPVKILGFIPPELPIHRLKFYLDSVIRHQMEKKRINKISKGLLRAEVLRLQEQKMNCQKKSITINDLTICPECKKRFTNQSAFVRKPNGDVVHLLCFNKN